jgi:hypothetical protein
MQFDESEAPPWPAPAICPECGYSMAGLRNGGDGGRCSECGWAFGPRTLLLMGHSGSGGLWLGRRKIGGALVIAAIGLAVGVPLLVQQLGWFDGWLDVLPRSLRGPAIPLLFLMLVGAFAVYVDRRLSRRPEVMMQMRLSDKGYACRRGLGPVKWRPWHRNMDIRATVSRGGMALTLVRNHLKGWVQTEPAEVTISCDPMFAAFIISWITHWINTAEATETASMSGESTPADGP